MFNITAPELLKRELPLVRHLEALVGAYGYKPGTAEFTKAFNVEISFYRKYVIYKDEEK